MTTPFAALAVMTKSAHAYSVEPSQVTSPVLHPFAQMDPFVKEARRGDQPQPSWIGAGQGRGRIVPSGYTPFQPPTAGRNQPAQRSGGNSWNPFSGLKDWYNSKSHSGRRSSMPNPTAPAAAAAGSATAGPMGPPAPSPQASPAPSGPMGPPAPSPQASPAPATTAPLAGGAGNSMWPGSGGATWDAAPSFGGGSSMRSGAGQISQTSPAPSASPAPYQGPTAADYERVMGSYNPNSSLDQRKAQAIDAAWKQNGGRMSPNQMYQDPGYMGINKSGSLTPFAILNADDMQKMAFNPAALIAKLTRQGGGALRRAGARARINTPHSTKPQNTPDVIQLGPSQATGAAAAPSKSTAMIPHPTANAAPAAMPGDRRMAAGNWLKGLATKMDDPTVAGRINTGVAAGGGAGLLYGGHRMGHSSGMSEGLDKGFDTGADYGIQAALANAPQDPGLFGRIADVFTGQQAGPQAYDIQSLLDANKAQILKQLRAA